MPLPCSKSKPTPLLHVHDLHYVEVQVDHDVLERLVERLVLVGALKVRLALLVGVEVEVGVRPLGAAPELGDGPELVLAGVRSPALDGAPDAGHGPADGRGRLAVVAPLRGDLAALVAAQLHLDVEHVAVRPRLGEVGGRVAPAVLGAVGAQQRGVDAERATAVADEFLDRLAGRLVGDDGPVVGRLVVLRLVVAQVELGVRC